MRIEKNSRYAIILKKEKNWHILTYERNCKLNVWSGRDVKRETILPTTPPEAGNWQFRIQDNQWSGRELKIRRCVKVRPLKRNTYHPLSPKAVHKLSHVLHA